MYSGHRGERYLSIDLPVREGIWRKLLIHEHQSVALLEPSHEELDFCGRPHIAIC